MSGGRLRISILAICPDLSGSNFLKKRRMGGRLARESLRGRNSVSSRGDRWFAAVGQIKTCQNVDGVLSWLLGVREAEEGRDDTLEQCPAPTSVV